MENLEEEVVARIALPAEVPMTGYYSTEYSIHHFEEDEAYLVTI